MRSLILILLNALLIVYPDLLYGQVIRLSNPSFEDFPRQSKPPQGWYVCGEPGESPPDVHPSGAFGVTRTPDHGISYVGLVVRQQGSREGLGQRLPIPLLAGHCYRWEVKLARSSTYNSFNVARGGPADYSHPTRLQVWGSQFNCQRLELLAQSSPVRDTAWRPFSLTLQPSRRIDQFLLVAGFAGDSTYNGHLLLDAAGPISPVDCQSQHPIFPPDTLQPDQLSGLSSSEILRRLTPLIRLDVGTDLPEIHYFYTPGRKTIHATNQYLYRLFRFLGDSGLELAIAINTRSRDRYQRRKFWLQQVARGAGLEPEQLRFRRWRQRLARQNWVATADRTFFLQWE